MLGPQSSKSRTAPTQMIPTRDHCLTTPCAIGMGIPFKNDLINSCAICSTSQDCTCVIRPLSELFCGQLVSLAVERNLMQHPAIPTIFIEKVFPLTTSPAFTDLVQNQIFGVRTKVQTANLFMLPNRRADLPPLQMTQCLLDPAVPGTFSGQAKRSGFSEFTNGSAECLELRAKNNGLPRGCASHANTYVEHSQSFYKLQRAHFSTFRGNH